MAITENFSEKKRRGRPYSYHGALVAVDPGGQLKQLFPDIGNRQKINGFYGIVTLEWFKGKEGFEWLFECKPGGEYRRRTILNELGRMPNYDTALHAARFLCEHKPKTDEALRYLRAYRQALRGKTKTVGNASSLCNRLIDALNAYVARYPDMDEDSILEAIELLRGTVIDTWDNL